MIEFYETVTSLVLLPPSIMLLLLFLWSIATIAIGFGSDLSIADWLPSEPSVGPNHEGMAETIQQTAGTAIGGVVLTPAKWLNLRDLPIIVWGGVFTIAWWVVSIVGWYVCDVHLFGKEVEWFWSTLLIMRNIAIALVATKFITQPMRNWFANHELVARDLVGEEVLIISYDASPTHGQARFKTDGAPLLLNIRTDGPILPKGTRVWITHYDIAKRIYIVSATTTSTPISST